MAANQIRTWIFGLAFAALVVGGWTVGGSGYASTGAAALFMIAALIAVRAIAGVAIFRFGRAPQPAPAFVRSDGRRNSYVSDPDAPGRARPREPGCSASL
jgi:hypothetical protein